MTQPGESECLKGAVHAASASLALTMSLYNLAAYNERHELHLARNSGFYALLWLWEMRNTWAHWREAGRSL